MKLAEKRWDSKWNQRLGSNSHLPYLCGNLLALYNLYLSFLDTTAKKQTMHYVLNQLHERGSDTFTRVCGKKKKTIKFFMITFFILWHCVQRILLFVLINYFLSAAGTIWREMWWWQWQVWIDVRKFLFPGLRYSPEFCILGMRNLWKTSQSTYLVFSHGFKYGTY